MTKLMRELIEKLEALPEAEQDALAREFLEALEGGVYELSDEQMEEVRKSLAEEGHVMEEDEARRFLRDLGK